MVCELERVWEPELESTCEWENMCQLECVWALELALSIMCELEHVWEPKLA